MGHTNDINSLAISSDGSFIATTSHDKTLRLWDTESCQQIGQPLEHTTSVYSVAISPSGELLMDGDFHGNLQLWSIKDTPAAASKMDSSCSAHCSEVKSGRNLHVEALPDTKKVIELNHWRYGFLPRSQCYDDTDPQMRQLCQQHISPSEVEDAIQRAIHAQLENAPLHLINTYPGLLCN
ncbi:WD40-repeat-containing domain protein [Suillus americanus]|nr:WD40-repeat-containing domain protein [Suillus americanus]